MSEKSKNSIKESATGKLADLVHNKIEPHLNEFMDELSDDEITWLLKSFGSMKIDIRKNLTKESNKRNMDSAPWRSDSPLDDILKENQ